MFVLDNESMRSIDARTIASGVPGLELMERAGAGAARAVLARPAWLLGTTLVVCGKGNNGGDGAVVARHLHAQGHAVELLLAAAADELEGDAATNLSRARKRGVAIHELGNDPATALRARHAASDGRLLVDALFGTGFRPPLREPWGAVCEAMGDLGRRVVALDCPSGLDGNTGDVDPRTARADVTMTFGYPKWGLFLAPGRSRCGRVERVDLQFPRAIAEEVAATSARTGLYVDRVLAAGWWPGRPIDAHKYKAGSLLVVGGSAGMSGAVVLAALGAYRAGAGLVEAAVPGAQRLAVDIHCIEALVHGLAETAQGSLALEEREHILALAGRHRAVLLGPGGGADPETARLFLELVDAIEGSLVVDADALHAVHRMQRLPAFPSRCVLTPHSGELSAMLGISAQELDRQRFDLLPEVAREWNVVLLHKGAPTMVVAPNGTRAVIGSGGPGLATAGSGDVLAGAVAALLAGGLEPFEAACLAAYLHGRSGDLVERTRGVAGVLARDLLDALSTAVREVEGWQR